MDGQHSLDKQWLVKCFVSRTVNPKKTTTHKRANKHRFRPVLQGKKQLCHPYLYLQAIIYIHIYHYLHIKWIDMFSSGLIYPPRDSNALRGEGFKLYFLRWPIRSCNQITHTSKMFPVVYIQYVLNSKILAHSGQNREIKRQRVHLKRK